MTRRCCVSGICSIIFVELSGFALYVAGSPLCDYMLKARHSIPWTSRISVNSSGCIVCCLIRAFAIHNKHVYSVYMFIVNSKCSDQTANVQAGLSLCRSLMNYDLSSLMAQHSSSE